MKKAGIITTITMGAYLLLSPIFANGQTIINRINTNKTNPFTKEITEDHGKIHVNYTDSTFNQSGKLIEVDNRQITDAEGDNNLFGRKDLLALQQSQPGYVDVLGNLIISNYKFQNGIFTDLNKDSRGVIPRTDKEVNEYNKIVLKAQKDHVNKNMQEVFYNDVDRSANEAIGDIHTWLNILEKEKNLPENQKTYFIEGQFGGDPEITRGLSENLYIKDKAGNKRTILLTEKGIEVLVEDVNQEEYTLVKFLKSGNKTYEFNGELKTATQKGTNFLNAKIDPREGNHSKTIYNTLAQKYFNANTSAKLNARIEALKTGKMYIKPNQDF